MTESSSETALVGQGDFVYEPLVDWAQLPDGWCFNEVVAVEVDSHDRVFVFSRSDHPVMIFDTGGGYHFTTVERPIPAYQESGRVVLDTPLGL